MDKLIETMLTQLPNLAIAVWVLWRQQATIDSLLNSQQKLIDRLLVYVDDDKQRAVAAVSQTRQMPGTS